MAICLEGGEVIWTKSKRRATFFSWNLISYSKLVERDLPRWLLAEKRDQLNLANTWSMGLEPKIEEKKYLLFQKSDFTMKRASVKVPILSFFLNHPTTQKISFHWAPLLAFPNVWRSICNFYYLLIFAEIFWVGIWVINLSTQLDLDRYTFFHWEIKADFE